jgi:preprotein translocase subunit SecA
MFFNKEKKQIKKYKKLVEKVKEIEIDIKKMSNEELKSYHFKLKENFNKIEALGLIREVISRTLNINLYDVQLIGALILNDAQIVEMKTGEGKTYVAIVTAYMSYFTNKSTYIITANEYLAERDSELCQRVFAFFNISVENIGDVHTHENKIVLYNASIIYTTANTIIFDFLRDNLCYHKNQTMIKNLDFAIIDEADSILIDEARTPMVIAGQEKNIDRDYFLFNQIAKSFTCDEELEKNDFNKVRNSEISLSESGYTKLENILKERKIITNGDDLYLPSNTRFIELLLNSLHANHILKENTDYIVKDSSIVIIDPKTGRLMVGNRYKNGLQQALEVKEKIEIKKEQNIMSSITMKNFLKKFKKLSGMTGTAKTESKELKSVYNLEIVSLDTNKPVIRKDKEDYLFFTKEKKINAVVKEIKRIHESKRPILIGTNTVEYSELLSSRLDEEKVPHELLNAKNHQRESEIIAFAGVKSSVVIATNMAGRGTDIMLGGNKDVIISKYIKELNLSEIDAHNKWVSDNNEVNDLGGLYIIGAERSISKRIDQQLIGRSGRQGDNGKSRFFVSLDDDIIINFSDNTSLKKLWTILGLQDDAANHKSLSSSVNKIQKKIDGMHYDARKQLLMFDEINESQRNIIFELRDKILNTENLTEFVVKFSSNYIKRLVLEYANESSFPENWDIAALEGKIKKISSLDIEIVDWFKNDTSLNEIDIINKIIESFRNKVENLYKNNQEEYKEILRQFSLATIDNKWSEQISGVNELRKNTQLRGYAQEKPLDEYKKEMLKEFTKNLMLIEKELFITISHSEKYLAKDISEQSYEEFYYDLCMNKSKTTFGIGSFMHVGM